MKIKPYETNTVRGIVRGNYHKDIILTHKQQSITIYRLLTCNSLTVFDGFVWSTIRSAHTTFKE